MKSHNSCCGYVAIIGAPNAGKSTLINQLVGSKISIVSPKVQTTRRIVRGVMNHGKSQVILVDTPGIFKPSGVLEKKIVTSAWKGAESAEYHVLLVDAAAGITTELKMLLEALAGKNMQLLAVLNKSDLVSAQVLTDLTNYLRKTKLFEEVIVISALRAEGLLQLKDLLATKVGPGEWIYEEDDITDQASRDVASEITREKLFIKLDRELPYSLKVTTDRWQENERGEITIHQTITVLRESQKKIILGEGGRMIKAVGAKARAELAEIFGQKVHLFLFVNVRANWMEQTSGEEI